MPASPPTSMDEEQDIKSPMTAFRSRSRRYPALRPVIAVFIALVFYIFFIAPIKSSVSARDALGATSSAFRSFTYRNFDVGRDGNNYGMSPSQCKSAFPRLFEAIDKTVDALDGEIITYERTIERSSHWTETRVMIYDNEVYAVEDWPDPIAAPRKFATLHAMDRALKAVSNSHWHVPNIEFSMTTGDASHDHQPNFAYDRAITDNTTWLMPDFGLYAWPAHDVGTWTQVRKKVQEVEATFESFDDKIPQLLWRGTAGFNKEVRESLLNVSAGKPWSAVEAINWFSDNFKEHTLSMADHCKYKYVAHAEGIAYSGRLKYLHNCESVIIAHEPAFETHDQHLMVSSGPEQNFVQVKRDWSDLEEKMEWLISHPEDAARIARNNVNTFRDRYLTPAAEACYWRRLFQAWSDVAFEPEFFEVGSDGGQKWRGTPYESFSLMGTLDWNKQLVG